MPILILITIINTMSFGSIFPFLPILRGYFGLHEAQIGYLVSAFGLASVIGSICFGLIGDRFGRKVVLVVPLLLSSLTYFAFGFIDSYDQFFLLRALSGFLAGNFAVAFAAASDMSTPATRFKYMGLIGASFSVGFIIGPMIGGFLINDDLTMIKHTLHMLFGFSALATLIASALTFIYFKETLPKEDRHNPTTTPRSILSQFIQVYSNKRIIFFTLLSIVFMSILSGLQVYAGIWLHDILNFNALATGFFWSFAAILLTVSQLVATRLFKTKAALVIGFVLYGAGFFLLMYTNNYLMLTVCSIAIFLSVGLITPSINTNVSLEGNKNQQGLIFGVNQAMSGIGRIIGPNIFGIIYAINYNYMWFTMSALSLYISLIIALFIQPVVKRKIEV